MNEQELIDAFKQLIEEVKLLGDWNSSNAYKLHKLNGQRHSLTVYLVDLGLESAMSIAYGSDETNREISIAQETRPKKKKDIAFHEGNYYRGINHLVYEMETYVSALLNAIDEK